MRAVVVLAERAWVAVRQTRGRITLPWVLRFARRRRRLLSSTRFVAVTGSCAKTTTKELVTAVLRARHPGVANPGTANSLRWVANTILACRRTDRFVAMELGSSGPGTLAPQAALLQPDIAVITNVGTDHHKAFGSLEATAREKSTVVRALRPGGMAVLNADDPNVLAMRELAPGPVLLVGRSESADLRAEDVSSAWPDPLSFTAVYKGERVRIETRLHGEHWVTAVLSALAVGVLLDVPLEEGARALAAVDPWTGRMQPVTTPAGVTFMCDDGKAPFWSFPATFDFLRQARGARKVMVIGTVSDYPGDAKRRYKQLARQALEVADEVVFAGPMSHNARGAAKQAGEERLHVFDTLQEAARHLDDTLRAGDLVLLKGSNGADHLRRLALTRTHRVRCWRTHCDRLKFCDVCPLLSVPIAPRRAPRRAAHGAAHGDGSRGGAEHGRSSHGDVGAAAAPSHARAGRATAAERGVGTPAG
ncbi:MAG TPA: UDP-N-acetylmuramoyl-tripeptide--D-alanyl-D-alanine ligase [Gemmatimonadaceae bacterium]|nr:UDP-N-acetylmuramoyl-tripeptide--D-alanyl-D-alanine ligase [Gemmatimonadaceae bacterium]